MKAIIVAAGMGRRLAPYTDDRPKTLVEVNGRSILERQVDAYRAAGVDEINIVRGYMKEKIEVAGARTFDNDEYRDNNILVSLFYAESAMDGGFLFSYSDIVFRPEVVRTVIETAGDYALVIDRRWHEAYVGRVNHPVEEGEVARVDDGRVTLVGKKTMPPGDATGEFIGLARFSADAAGKMRERFHQRRAEHAGKPYGRAPRFEVAYLTDLLNDLIGSGEVMRPAFIDGGWREIDTVEDLERAKAVVSW
ncbi:MAG: phosphocholine cytidylyltransferase family protein [bacterium]|nr:phosphocholine cytidylyltransferase family protein [bacterium]